ncbi:MAG: hypothetical protein A2937_01925 [Candidatus Yonathbacteria bacterium RIFCSPLOWO2_01_FULL_47_33b]|uniref:Inner membrane protein YgaP-like transmembrane domain-containing protein n=1 Tax=Candidatus Yonathbacteria bacterium RIFCSPLOWO2_01_FULL_47_33b TaxID=1802727 RepID=A0A1G2SGL7_9BACT|nr:MAG: hypothetical protein A2937_01925 [Candidatus Yonathbacteria bacterium RIFCSPLOWO2_01_FULL_47_33b]
MLKFAKFMATAPGRIIRVVAGAAIIWWGSMIGDTTTGMVVILVGAIPFFAGILNLCMIAPFIGVPFKGKDILALPDAQ